jgi:hypothetical protein
MAWNELGVKWEPAARPGDVGWVYIYTHPTKTSCWRSKTSRYDLQTLEPPCTGVEPPHKRVEPPWIFRTTQVTIQKKS